MSWFTTINTSSELFTPFDKQINACSLGPRQRQSGLCELAVIQCQKGVHVSKGSFLDSHLVHCFMGMSNSRKHQQTRQLCKSLCNGVSQGWRLPIAEIQVLHRVTWIHKNAQCCFIHSPYMSILNCFCCLEGYSTLFKYIVVCLCCDVLYFSIASFLFYVL